MVRVDGICENCMEPCGLNDEFCEDCFDHGHHPCVKCSIPNCDCGQYVDDCEKCSDCQAEE